MKQWLLSYWVTYVRMSRRERRTLIQVLRNQHLENDFTDAKRPEGD